MTLRPRTALLGTIARGLLIDHFRRSALESSYLKELAQLPENLQPSPEEQTLALDALRQIDRLLMSEALRRDLAAGGREHVMQEFHQEVNLDRLLGYWVLAGHASRLSRI